MDYFYLKIGTGNSDAREWLAGHNPLHRPAAVIYFDNLSAADYRIPKDGKVRKEALTFFQRGQPEFHNRTLMVVVHDGEVWILRPAGPVRVLRSRPNAYGKPHTPKAMPVKALAHRKAKDVPPVLATINANRFLTLGTFRRINDDWGCYKAIDCALGGQMDGNHWKLKEQGPLQLLECLSSVELETLVAKLFEARGCFVPAYRGGVMKDMDVLAYNEANHPIQLRRLVVPPQSHVSIQVKRCFYGLRKERCVDYLIGLDVKGRGAFDAAWLLERVRECMPVAVWLRRSLSWLPESFLDPYHLVN